MAAIRRPEAIVVSLRPARRISSYPKFQARSISAFLCASFIDLRMSSVPSSAIFFVGPPQIQRGNALAHQNAMRLTDVEDRRLHRGVLLRVGFMPTARASTTIAGVTAQAMTAFTIWTPRNTTRWCATRNPKVQLIPRQGIRKWSLSLRPAMMDPAQKPSARPPRAKT